MTDDRPHDSLAKQGRYVKFLLVIGSVLVVASCVATGMALSQDIHPLNTRADIEWQLDELVKIHDVCWQNQGCEVLPKEEIEALRNRVKELEQRSCT